MHKYISENGHVESRTSPLSHYSPEELKRIAPSIKMERSVEEVSSVPISLTVVRGSAYSVKQPPFHQVISSPASRPNNSNGKFFTKATPTNGFFGRGVSVVNLLGRLQNLILALRKYLGRLYDVVNRRNIRTIYLLLYEDQSFENRNLNACIFRSSWMDSGRITARSSSSSRSSRKWRRGRMGCLTAISPALWSTKMELSKCSIRRTGTSRMNYNQLWVDDLPRFISILIPWTLTNCHLVSISSGVFSFLFLSIFCSRPPYCKFIILLGLIEILTKVPISVQLILHNPTKTSTIFNFFLKSVFPRILFIGLYHCGFEKLNTKLRYFWRNK